MATSISSRIAPLKQEPLSSENLVTALRPWRRRIFAQQTLRWFVRGCITGLFLACIVLLASRLTPWATAPYWALGLGIACPLLALIAALWYRPSIASTSRAVDEQLSLHDRVGTAWELREETSALAALQRRDALKQLQKHTPRTAISLRIRRTTLITFAILALALVLLIVLPNPMNAVLKQQADFHANMAKQIASIEKLRQEIAQLPDLPQSEKQQIDQTLRDLEAKLQNAQNNTDAQQALAQAQAKLDQMRNPATASKVQAQQAAGSSLQNSSNPNLKSAGQALSNNDSKSLSQALQNLSSQLNKMTAAQRQQLSQQLEQAANQSSQNSDLSSALHQAAKAVSDNNPSELSDAASSIEAAASQDASAQSSDNALSQASQNLQQDATNLASSTDNSTSKTQSQGQQGQSQQGQGQQGQQSQNQGQQGQQAQGQGQGQGQGQQGQQGQGQGQQAQGQGQGQGKGQQGQGQGQSGQGTGGNGGNNGAGNKQGKDEQISIRGQLGQGNSTSSTDNNNSSVVTPGNSVPYQQVIQQYNQAAHDAIDNSNVSPDMKDLVHNYFNSLEGQQ